MPLCFIEPQDAIRVIAESVGREARRQLLGELVRAWVDEIPENELASHYAKAVADLDEHDLSMLAAWHGSLEVGQPVPNRDFLMGAFPSLGENRREALKLAAGFRGEEAVDAGVTEEDALELVLSLLSPARQMELAVEAVELADLTRADCDDPHDAEVLLVIDTDPEQAAAYRPVVPDTVCVDALDESVDEAVQDQKLLVAGLGDTDSLDEGDTLVCFGFAADGSRLDGRVLTR